MIVENLKTKLAKGKASEKEIKDLYRKLAHDTACPYRSDMAQRASQFGYFKWPARLSNYVAGKRVLDVGCGSGLHGLGFITFGASVYVGVEPSLVLDKDRVKNKNLKRIDGKTPKQEFGWTPQEICVYFPNIKLINGTNFNIDPLNRALGFDVISMHTVTEHLMDIESVFADLYTLLRPGGVVIFVHDNFYSWKGHHMKPKSVSDINVSDPEQLNYIDWNHLTFDPPEGHYFRRALNKIRLDDLKILTERYFNIQIWDEIENDFGRLTDEIIQRALPITRRELVVSNVYCVAKRSMPTVLHG